MLRANYMRQIPDFIQVMDSLKSNVRYNLNCIKIAIVEEFYPETLEVQCRIVNKKLMGLNNDGTQIVRDYPPIFARCHFFGWGDVGITYPITKGMEGFLLFNDRELESWFINGGVNSLKYERCHDLTDAIFICGLHSKPNMIDFAKECFNIYYKKSNIVLNEEDIKIEVPETNLSFDKEKIAIKTKKISLEGDYEQTGNSTINGILKANSLEDDSAFTGTFITKNDKTVTVEKGIIKNVS